MPEISSKIAWIIILALVAFVCAFFYVISATGRNTRQETESVQEPTQESVWIVEYEAQHDHARNNGLSITYAIAAAGGAVQEEIGRLEMEKTNGKWAKTQQFEPGSFLFLSVQNKSPIGGVTCRIKVNGVVISEHSPKSAYDIATCTNQ